MIPDSGSEEGPPNEPPILVLAARFFPIPVIRLSERNVLRQLTIVNSAKHYTPSVTLIPCRKKNTAFSKKKAACLKRSGMNSTVIEKQSSRNTSLLTP